MVERLLCKQEVDGSIPFVSTIKCLVIGGVVVVVGMDFLPT